MVFSSLFFVYAFLPACLICYSLFSGIKNKNRVLLVFSLLFYAWTAPKYLILLLTMAFINYVGGMVIERRRGTPAAKTALIMAVALSLVLLGIFKYTGFLAGISKSLFGWPEIIPQILLPIGISFYTFQLISYTADVYRGDATGTSSYFTVLLYASLFYQCIAGPIVRYKDVEDEIQSRKVSGKDLSEGINRFITGLAKKAILANGCGQLVDQLIPAKDAALSTAPALALWLGMIFYALQIYLDFSAYSDMAIGMGHMVGFHFLENFNYPYISKSITEFWRRWHMSLGTFFRDYVYIPLGGNRRGLPRQIWNMFVVWALTGLWHGANWNFVIWGLYSFLFLVLEKAFLLKKLEKVSLLGHIYTLILVVFSWTIFRTSDMSQIWLTIRGMLFLNGNPWTDFTTNTLLLNRIVFLAACLIACVPWVRPLHSALTESAKTSRGFYWLNAVLETAVPIVLLILATMALVGDSYNPFLYFQF